MSNRMITIETVVNAPMHKVWELWTSPEHIVKWNNASIDWHTPTAKNDFRVDGKFLYRMKAIDGSEGFDFGGVYNEIIPNEKIAYTIGDGRQVTIFFTVSEGHVTITETFETEEIHSIDIQKSGWQYILDNFKKYAEKNSVVKNEFII